jgi:sugar (pentulose or hexulose) kinase
MAMVSRKLCARATPIAALVVFAGTAAGQACSGSGVPLFGGNSDQYTASVSAGVNIEGPTGTQTCTLNVVAGQGQQYLCDTRSSGLTRSAARRTFFAATSAASFPAKTRLL